MSAESYPEFTPEALENQLWGSEDQSYSNEDSTKQEGLFRSSAKAERRMLASFYDYCQSQNIDLNPDETGGGKRLTEVAHDFIASAVERKITEQAPAKPDEPPLVVDAPRQQIKKIYDNYYRKFDEATIKAGGQVKERQLAFLNDSLDFAAAYGFSPERNKVVRHSRRPRYAAVNIALRLEDNLRNDGKDEAADSVEVLIAAYGQRFNTLVKGLGVSAFDAPRYSTGVVTDFDIPNEHKAEDKIIY